jgi:hypothetical protein
MSVMSPILVSYQANPIDYQLLPNYTTQITQITNSKQHNNWYPQTLLHIELNVGVIGCSDQKHQLLEACRSITNVRLIDVITNSKVLLAVLLPSVEALRYALMTVGCDKNSKVLSADPPYLPHEELDQPLHPIHDGDVHPDVPPVPWDVEVGHRAVAAVCGA